MLLNYKFTNDLCRAVATQLYSVIFINCLTNIYKVTHSGLPAKSLRLNFSLNKGKALNPYHKQKIVYQYLADKNKQDALNSMKSKRYTSYIILGGGIILLAGVVILLSRKKHE